MKKKIQKCLSQRPKHFFKLIPLLFFLDMEISFAQFEDLTATDISIDQSLFSLVDLQRQNIKSIGCVGIRCDFGDIPRFDTILVYRAECDEFSRIKKEVFISEVERGISNYNYWGNECFINKTVESKNSLLDTIFVLNYKKIAYSKNGRVVSSKLIYENNSITAFPFIIIDTFFYENSSKPDYSYQIWLDKQNPMEACTLKVEYRYDLFGAISEYKKMPLGNIEKLLKFTSGSMTDLTAHVVVDTDPCKQDPLAKGLGASHMSSSRFRFTTLSPDGSSKVVHTNNTATLLSFIKKTKLPDKINIAGNSYNIVYSFFYTTQ